MSATTRLQPTLWRTCRTLANRTRLQMFSLLLQKPRQTVSAVAQHLRLPLSSSSEYLRALESRGLLRAWRISRSVEYQVSSPTDAGPLKLLIPALREVFQREINPVEIIFRQATAFTHPQRIEVFRAVKKGAKTCEQIHAVTRMSVWALVRHLRKLEDRGFVTYQDGMYSAVKRTDVLGQALAQIAVE